MFDISERYDEDHYHSYNESTHEDTCYYSFDRMINGKVFKFLSICTKSKRWYHVSEVIFTHERRHWIRK